jgi:uncharacterized protein DUF6510
MAMLDGNAIAGELYDVFGAEMTTVTGVCASCGARHQLGEQRVYVRGPGTVVRCKSCTSIVLVLVEIRGYTCVDLRGLAAIDLHR